MIQVVGGGQESFECKLFLRALVLLSVQGEVGEITGKRFSMETTPRKIYDIQSRNLTTSEFQ